MVSFAILGASVMQNATAPPPPAVPAVPVIPPVPPVPLTGGAIPPVESVEPLAAAAGNAATSAATAAANGASALGEAGFSWGGYFQAIGVLCLLLAVLWGATWAIRKYGKFNFLPKPGGFPRDALRMEAQLPLGPRKGVVVVRFLNKRLLLGVTDHQITLLTESADDHDESNITEFKDILQEVQRQKTDVEHS